MRSHDGIREEVRDEGNSLSILKSAKNLLEIEGSGISLFPGEADGLVRCDSCFAMHCDKNPQVASKDPFFLGHHNSAASGGNTLTLGLIIERSRKEKLIEGHNDAWYRFKNQLIDHVSCGSRKSGGDQHYRGLIAKKHRQAREKTIMKATTNQLKCAIKVVKIKSAALHFEDLISLLASTGVFIGNLGHGRKQLNPIIKAFQAYMLKKLKSILSTPLKSTGLLPHYSTTSDKSTPIKVSNHAIMILVPINGKKEGIPICAPKVYEYEENDLTGGTADHLAEQVLNYLLELVKLDRENLSYLVAHQADGQYQAREFLKTLRSKVHVINRPNHLEKYFVVP